VPITSQECRMKTRIKEIIKSLLKNVLGIQILRVKNIPAVKEKPKLKMKYVHDPATSYMINPVYQDMLVADLSRCAEDFFSHNYFPLDPGFIVKDRVAEFFEIYCGRTLTDNTHGSGFHNAFWIYLFAKAINPALIVESGVWKAHTTWLLSQACPESAIYGFDRNLKNVEYDILQAQMFEQDWQSFQFPEFDPDRALIFFDCHVNHAQRLIEAKAKGFKHILFDDNPPIYKVFSHIPGIPTASMLYADQGIDSTEISWIWNGEEIIRSIDPDQASQAKDLIKVHHILPDVGGPTRYGGFAFLTYVQI
jgi:hypothetical protein